MVYIFFNKLIISKRASRYKIASCDSVDYNIVDPDTCSKTIHKLYRDHVYFVKAYHNYGFFTM